MRRFSLAYCLLAMGLSLATQAALAGYDAAPSRETHIDGRWKLNASLSDDAERMLQKRLEEERKRREQWMRRAREAGELWLPPDPENPEIGAPGTAEEEPAPPPPRRNESRKRRDDELRKMLGISDTLEVVHSGATVSIASQVDARRFEAGIRSQVSMPQGELADSSVGWDGDWFVIERRARNGPRVVEKYRWLKKTDQLESVVAWSGETTLAGIKVKRIYDRVVGALPPPDPRNGPVK